MATDRPGETTDEGPLHWRPGDPLEPLAERLARGEILAIPTESSYGLAVDPRNETAVRRIFRLKGREGGKALPVVAADTAQIEVLGASLADPLLRRAAELWPAPLSLLVPLARPLPAAPGHTHVAVRVPAHALLRRLLRSLGTALTATSANPAGEAPILRPEGLLSFLPPGSAIVDAGVLPGGAPSTLVLLEQGDFRVLRRGRYPLHRLARRLGLPEVPEGAGEEER